MPRRLPNGIPARADHIRSASTAVIVKVPAGAPLGLFQPFVPGAKGPSSLAFSSCGSQLGQAATSVAACQMAVMSPAMTISSPNEYIAVSLQVHVVVTTLFCSHDNSQEHERQSEEGPRSPAGGDDVAPASRHADEMRKPAVQAADIPETAKSNQRLAILLAMAMFVLVVDPSLMNVSISAVVKDLGTTVSGVQSAIALEALVSAAFILIGSKVGDLIGRKLAYFLGLPGYAVGALAMAFAQSLTAIIVFWAVVGGLGASLLLPAMQSLIHGNFEGAAQKKAYALVGASAAIAAAVGPLLGGFVTTYLSWRVGFLFEVAVIAVVLSGIKLVHDVPYTGSRQVDVVGAVLSVLAMGGIVLGILIWQEGGESVLAVLAIGAAALVALVWWLRRRHRQGKPTLLDPELRSEEHTSELQL